MSVFDLIQFSTYERLCSTLSAVLPAVSLNQTHVWDRPLFGYAYLGACGAV